MADEGKGSPVRGSHVGEIVCKALGLDASSIECITLTLDANDVARVETKGFLRSKEDHQGMLRKITEDYVLVPRWWYDQQENKLPKHWWVKGEAE